MSTLNSDFELQYPKRLKDSEARLLAERRFRESDEDGQREELRRSTPDEVRIRELAERELRSMREEELRERHGAPKFWSRKGAIAEDELGQELRREAGTEEFKALVEARTRELMEGLVFDQGGRLISDRVGSARDKRVGVALSGGGIRSATFCLGVFQALAEARLLGKVDYLSTVSGGGYFGSFYGRLFTRDWIESAEEEAMPRGDEDLAAIEHPIERAQEVLGRRRSWCMRYLRDSGRYLSPNRAGDFWLAIGMFLRNWLSMLFSLWVLAFAVFALMAFVRALVWPFASGTDTFLGELWLATRAHGHLWWSPWIAVPLLVLGFYALPSALAYWLSLETWSKSRLLRGLHRWISRLTPYVVLVMSLAVAFFWPYEAFPWAVIGLIIVVALTFVYWFGQDLITRRWPRRWNLIVRRVIKPRWEEQWKRLVERWGWLAPREAGDRYTVRNRLARRMTRGIMVALALIIVVLIDSLGQSIYAVSELYERLGRPRGIVAILSSFAALGGIAAFGQRIGALLQKLPQRRVVQIPATLLAGAAGALLAVVLLLSASFAAQVVAWEGREPVVPDPSSSVHVLVPGAGLVEPTDPGEAARRQAELRQVRAGLTVSEPDPWPLFVTLAAALVLGWLFGRTFGFFNLSSLHSFYAARLARAYLGASNKERFDQKDTTLREALPSDDIAWDDYHPWERGGPLHIVNQTLNETVSGRTQIEYRDRKGLIMAHGPAGLSVGAHDHGLWGRHPEDARPDALLSRSWRKKETWRDKFLFYVTPLNTRQSKFHALGLPSDRSSPAPAGDSGSASVLQAFGEPTRVERCKLGRNVAISGAAFTTGTGYRTHVAISLLAGLLNVRLGYWWTFDLTRRKREKRGTCTRWDGGRTRRAFSALFPVQAQLIDELTAQFHGPAAERWYLSDGGHFENTGAYELIRRRIPFIVVCDCGQDRNYGFRDISALARQVRVDFGAELQILGKQDLKDLRVHRKVRKFLGTPEKFAVPVESGKKAAEVPRRTRKHAVLARVRHCSQDGPPCPDAGREANDDQVISYLLFLKPSLDGDEPQDVLYYQSAKIDFPNESTLDQYFDEAQWESYRRLGVHVARRLFCDYKGDDMDKWQPRDMRAPRAASVS